MFRQTKGNAMQTQAQATADDMVRLLKLYSSGNMSADARRETAKAIKALAELLCKQEERSAMTTPTTPLPPIEPAAPLHTRGGVMPCDDVLRNSDGLPIIRPDSDPER
jgi:hypothetical protein